MFTRIKKRKDSSGKTKKYAYLVRSKRRKKSKKHPKQKVVAYLGRIIQLNNHQQSSTIINKGQNIKTTIKAMLADLLLSNGFKSSDKTLFTKNTILVDLSKKQVKHKETGQKFCLQVNEGFMTNYTLKQILNYKPPETTEKGVGMDFAQKILSAGLKPNKEAFLELYSSISKDFHRK